MSTATYEFCPSPLPVTRREFAGTSLQSAAPAHTPRPTVRPVLAGAFVGLIAAYGAAAVLTRFLFNTLAREPLTFLSIAVVIVLTSALASLIPARRVSDISGALRSE